MSEKSEKSVKRPYTEARKNSNIKWDKQNLDRISIAVKKGKRDIIKAHAAITGESMNVFINRAIDETIEQDQKKKESIPEYES